MAKALLIQDFQGNQKNSCWVAREYNESTDAKAAQQIPIDVLRGVLEALEAEARETANTWLLKRQAINYPPRTTKQRPVFGDSSIHGKLITNFEDYQSYLKDGKVVTLTGKKKYAVLRFVQS